MTLSGPVRTAKTTPVSIESILFVVNAKLIDFITTVKKCLVFVCYQVIVLLLVILRDAQALIDLGRLETTMSRAKLSSYQQCDELRLIKDNKLDYFSVDQNCLLQ